MANLQEVQTKVETKIETLHLAERENQRITKWDEELELQQHLQLFEKRFEEIHETKYKVQEMMIERNAKEEAIDKWTADEKLEEMEQPMANIEEVIKNCESRKSIKEKNLEEQRFEKKIR